MAIEFECSGCSSTLRVPDEHSGKHARCPKCSTVNAIPINSLPTAAQPIEEPYKATSTESDLFGSLDSNSKTNATPYENDPDKNEYSQFTQPGDEHSSSSITYGSSESSNFYSTEGYSPEGYTTSSYSSGYGPTSHLQPHRGGTILALGVLSLFCNFLLVPGIMAWTMGVSDLKQIRSGTMAPEGRGLATAGMIIGAIMTVVGICIVTFIVATIFVRATRIL